MQLIHIPPPFSQVDIRLEHREVNLLLALMRNPTPNENDEIRQLRESLFNVLRQGLTRNGA